MIGRRVQDPWGRLPGVVVQWEPLGPALCDVLVRHDNGFECWHPSTSLRPIDDLGPLPSRSEAQEAERVKAITGLREILAQHVRDWEKDWPGCNFGKSIVGQSIVRAIEELEAGRRVGESSVVFAQRVDAEEK